MAGHIRGSLRDKRRVPREVETQIELRPHPPGRGHVRGTFSLSTLEVCPLRRAPIRGDARGARTSANPWMMMMRLAPDLRESCAALLHQGVAPRTRTRPIALAWASPGNKAQRERERGRKSGLYMHIGDCAGSRSAQNLLLLAGDARVVCAQVKRNGVARALL